MYSFMNFLQLSRRKQEEFVENFTGNKERDMLFYQQMFTKIDTEIKFVTLAVTNYKMTYNYLVGRSV